jgi:phosphotransferase system  glucose/maltose/N-acetylglucosamine-specific IIC component
LVVGGGETLEGASYFWFYVIVMLVTAILFIPVVFLYKPKEYLQTEAGVEEMESVSGAIGDQ